MNHSIQIPPIYEKLHKIFSVEWNHGIAITYGDTVYSKYPLTADIEVHEQVHISQQAEMGAEEWWEGYLHNATFRLGQEIQAYSAQIAFLEDNIHDKNFLYRAKLKIINDLSGPMYGRICTFSEAKGFLSA